MNLWEKSDGSLCIQFFHPLKTSPAYTAHFDNSPVKINVSKSQVKGLIIDAFNASKSLSLHTDGIMFNEITE